MKIKLELIKSLPEIIAQSVKPMENIEGIKILQVNGLTGQSGNTLEGESQSTNLADQMTNSALRYRAQAPLVDSLMNELGIKEYHGYFILDTAVEKFLILDGIPITSSLSDTYLGNDLSKFMPRTTVEIIEKFEDDIKNKLFSELENFYSLFSKKY